MKTAQEWANLIDQEGGQVPTWQVLHILMNLDEVQYELAHEKRKPLDTLAANKSLDEENIKLKSELLRIGAEANSWVDELQNQVRTLQKLVISLETTNKEHRNALECVKYEVHRIL